jgi:TorA maturation chaperone TorD
MKEYGQRKAGKLVSDHVRPWLAGFVEAVGQEEAAQLLHRVGELDPIP